MRERKALIILGSGILIAVSAGLLTYGRLNEKVNTHARAAETQLVAVAAADLEWGTVISKDMIKTVPFLKQSLPGGCFSDAAGLEGRTLAYPVRTREPIFESRLAPSSLKVGGMGAVIGAQKRAMAVEVDKVIGVAGLVHPGDRVDVIAILDRTERVPVPIAKTVLENVLVLARGSEAERTGKNEKATPADVVTLEVGADEGAKLALAATEGKLHLALRNLGDSTRAATRGTTVLLSSFRDSGARNEPKGTPGMRRPAQPAVLFEQNVESVELIRGTSVIVLRFRKGE